MTMYNPGYEVVWPRGKKTVGTLSFAKRLDTLHGKTIAFLWNYLFRGPDVFPIIEKELAKRYAGIKFVRWDVFGSISGAKEVEVLASLPDMRKQYKFDAVIVGVGC